jgi:hypothetical protein
MHHRRCCDDTFAYRTLWTVIERFADSSGHGNDSGEQVSRDDEGPSLEIGLLAELRAVLAERDIGSELREDLACLAVKMTAPDSRLWVFVSFGSRYFSWNNAELQHPVRDMQGAARRIATQINDMSSRPEGNHEA